MKDLIRKKHKFLYWNKHFYAWTLTVWDYISFLESETETLEKILLEYNDSIPLLNKRQLHNFIEILMNGDTTINIEKLWLKKINKKVEVKKILNDLMEIEVSLSSNFHISPSEIHGWTLHYYNQYLTKLNKINKKSQKSDKNNNDNKNTNKQVMWKINFSDPKANNQLNSIFNNI